MNLSRVLFCTQCFKATWPQKKEKIYKTEMANNTRKEGVENGYWKWEKLQTTKRRAKWRKDSRQCHSACPLFVPRTSKSARVPDMHGSLMATRMSGPVPVSASTPVFSRHNRTHRVRCLTKLQGKKSRSPRQSKGCLTIAGLNITASGCETNLFCESKNRILNVVRGPPHPQQEAQGLRRFCGILSYS